MGMPAARLTDLHVCPMVTGVIPHVGGPIMAPGAPTTLIGGLPAARVTDMLTCVGPPDVIVKGSTGVMIGGLPAARLGDMTAHGGVILLGCFTVLIGEAGGGSGNGSGGSAGGNGSADGDSAGVAEAGGNFDELLSTGAAMSSAPLQQAQVLVSAAKTGAALCARCVAAARR